MMIMRKTKDKSMNVSEDEFVEICISVIKGLLNLKMEREGDINTPWSHMSKDERYRNFLREYEKLCKKCHNERSPHYEGFDFKKRYEEIKHTNK